MSLLNVMFVLEALSFSVIKVCTKEDVVLYNTFPCCGISETKKFVK